MKRQFAAKGISHFRKSKKQEHGNYSLIFGKLL